MRQASRILYTIAGAAAAISLSLALAGPLLAGPFFLGSLGASTVILFAFTDSPAAQPRALFGGHLGAALVGIVCQQLWGDALWVYALAEAGSVAWMFASRTLHPPAGATTLLMVHLHAGFGALLQPVLIGTVSLALVTFIWTRLHPGLRHYPVRWSMPSPPDRHWGAWHDAP